MKRRLIIICTVSALTVPGCAGVPPRPDSTAPARPSACAKPLEIPPRRGEPLLDIDRYERLLTEARTAKRPEARLKAAADAREMLVAHIERLEAHSRSYDDELRRAAATYSAYCYLPTDRWGNYNDSFKQ